MPQRCLRAARFVLCCAGVFAGAATSCLAADGPDDAAAIEFFESKVRPLLVERCHKCHGAKKHESNLRLDSRQSILKGGDTGPAIVPGKPEESLLVDAINYGETYQMPPKAKLPADKIAILTEWVRRGAPWSKDSGPAATARAEFNLAERCKSHWAWQPIRVVAPPSVRDAAWPVGDVDRYILSKLEQNNLQPAPPADRRTLARRLYFDLVGLPPSRDSLAAFLGDESPAAVEKLVDRLLASPHFGERWGRHWLDLVRYAETNGHEFDRSIFNAWRYRDYVIRALNDDVPYNDFVIEHLAGDLVGHPRRNPATGANESLIGTGFFWLGEQTHSPVDVQQHAADRIDNEIDVLGKAFLGMTVACARCHDHKFDAISTKDYYALYGVLASSRYAQRAIDAAERVDSAVVIASRVAKQWRPQVAEMAEYLLAARKVAAGKRAEDMAAAAKLDAGRLERWVAALADPALGNKQHPLFAWSALAGLGEDIGQRWPTLRAELAAAASTEPADAATVVLADFSRGDLDGWFVDGLAFAGGLTRPGDFTVGPSASEAIASINRGGWVDSGRWGARLQGALRSPTFTIQKRYVHVLARGRGSRINVIVDGFSLICDPIYGGLKRRLDDDVPRWHTFDLEMWKGHSAYIELLDTMVQDPVETAPYPDNGYIAAAKAVLSDAGPPQLFEPCTSHVLLGERPIASLENLAQRYEDAAVAAVRAWPDSPERLPLGQAQTTLLEWLRSKQLLQTVDEPHKLLRSLGELVAEYHAAAAKLPAPTYVPAMADGSGIDARVFIRGSYKTRGDVVPRRFLEAISGSDQMPTRPGSGRLDIAYRMVDENNPLVSRAIVNRVWHHLFGRGIVATVDNLGALGEPPTHPELLDYLAYRFVREDWSIKGLIRSLVLSRTYQMASTPSAAARQIDPQNRLWHSTNVRRLEGEAIRDSLLAVSGRLDAKLFGPSVPIHLTPFMEGRGRPGESGPLDGLGRRSIYVEVRRNFLSPMMLAFDAPQPTSCVGRRGASNVPAQALTMLNDPLVQHCAQRWARRALADPAQGSEARLRILFETAFARPPTADESRLATDFVAAQAQRYGCSPDDVRVWSDLCHVMLNLKEFVFVE